VKEREIDVSWPIAGLPGSMHVDNGADFRSKAFIHGCRNEGVDIIWRPPGQPHYGGHIERLIGTMMGEVHLLPGVTEHLGLRLWRERFHRLGFGFNAQVCTFNVRN